jgi:hypothetical protein
MSLGIVVAGWPGQAIAEAVDTELVLLVDVTSSALNNKDFTQLMDGYATAFSSTQIMDSIQSGASKRIAVSLMFFGDAGSQQVGIPWMMIENGGQALQFANELLNVTRPSWGSTADIGAGLSAAASSFGTETGGSANGFESAFQIIEVADSKKPKNNSAAAVSASSAAALTAGVDVINALALGNQSGSINDFYAANVIGSTVEGIAATSTASALNNTLAVTLTSSLGQTIQASADSSITAVPEPGRMLALVTGIIFLLKRRRL